jgi:hypothetical protein
VYAWDRAKAAIAAEARQYIKEIRKDHAWMDRADSVNWHSISLMHCDEKQLTRMLTTRLQPHLAPIIDPSPSVFVRGRSIFDYL